MHQIQIDILKRLLFAENLRYSKMKPYEMEGSLFTFHLDKLIKEGFIKKENGEYSLTEYGKAQTNAIDFDSPKPNKQAKVSVVVCATRNSDKEILIYTRLKNPFYGRQGFPTGKVQYGENVIDAAQRELKEETNLEGKLDLIGIRHFKVYFPDENTLVEDKIFYIHRIDNPKGELESNNEGGFYWCKISDIKKMVKNPLPEFEEILEVLLKGKNLSFREINQYPSSF